MNATHKTTTPAEHIEAMLAGLEGLKKLGEVAGDRDIRKYWRLQAEKVKGVIDRYRWDLENGG